MLLSLGKCALLHVYYTDIKAHIKGTSTVIQVYVLRSSEDIKHLKPSY